MDYDDEREPGEEELPEFKLEQEAECSICGKEECTNGCFRCGQPVCYNGADYLSDSTCGAWILDSWHPAAPGDNEFYCRMCLYAGRIEEGPVTVGGLTFLYSDHKTLQITVDGGQPRELNTEETRNLVAFLSHQRGALFVDESKAAEPVMVSSQQNDDLPSHPF